MEGGGAHRFYAEGVQEAKQFKNHCSKFVNNPNINALYRNDTTLLVLK